MGYCDSTRIRHSKHCYDMRHNPNSREAAEEAMSEPKTCPCGHCAYYASTHPPIGSMNWRSREDGCVGTIWINGRLHCILCLAELSDNGTCGLSHRQLEARIAELEAECKELDRRLLDALDSANL